MAQGAVGTQQQQHAMMMMQQIPGTPPSPPQQLSQAQMQSSPLASILPRPGGTRNDGLAKGQVFKSDRTIQKLSQSDTLFRLYSEGPKASSGGGQGASALSSAQPLEQGAGAVDSVDAQGSPRGQGDNQDSLFKLFTASPSSFGAAPAASGAQEPTDGGSKAAAQTATTATSSSDDSAELPQTPNDVAAMKDLAALSQDPSAGQAQLPDSSAASSSSSFSSSSSSSSLAASSAALPPAPAPAPLRATDAADRGLFDIWQVMM